MFNDRSAILAVAIALLGACTQRTDNGPHMSPHAADIVVTATGTGAPIASGQSAEFTVTVANAGPNDASDVRIVDTVGTQSNLVTITCTAQGTAVCPDSIGRSMTVPKLPNGSSLAFHLTLKLTDSAGTGTIVNSIVASYVEDPDPNNNTVATDAMVR